MSDKDGEKPKLGTSLVVPYLRGCASTAGSTGPICSQGAKIPHALQHVQKIGGEMPKLNCCLQAASTEKNLNVNLSNYM